MIQRLPRWWRRLHADTTSEIKELKRLRQEAEEIIDRTLRATLNDDDEYWRLDNADLSRLTCGIDNRKSD